MLRLSQHLRFRASSICRSGGMNPKPRWEVPPEMRFEPTRPDRVYYSEHWNYPAYTLNTRAWKPVFENTIGGFLSAVKDVYSVIFGRFLSRLHSHLPDIRYQFIALLSFMCVQGAFILPFFGFMLEKQQGEISTLLQLAHAKKLDEAGFWASESDDLDKREYQLKEDNMFLNETWESAKKEATETRSFDALLKALEVGDSEVPSGVPSKLTMRFNMLPYGKDNPAAHAFPHLRWEFQAKPFLMNWPPIGNYGDYIDRQDIKTGSMRHARLVYADVFIAGTK